MVDPDAEVARQFTESEKQQKLVDNIRAGHDYAKNDPVEAAKIREMEDKKNVFLKFATIYNSHVAWF